MLKTYSKGARRRAKKNSLGLPELAGSKTRQPDGRLRPEVDRQDPARLALEVRCRHAGLEVTRANLRDVRAQWCGCAAGRAMASAVTDNDERARLWDAIQHMRRVQVSYDRAIGAPGRHAKCLRLLVPIEALSADAETPPLDERSDEEKLRDANRALMQLEGWLGYTDKAARSEARRVIVDDSEARDIAGLLSALLCIADGLAGRRVMVWRGRA